MKLEKWVMSLGLAATVFNAGCANMSGESTMPTGESQVMAAERYSNGDDDLAKALARAEMAQAEAQAARAEAAAAKAALEAASQNNATGVSGELFPPDALPGHCYARVLIPAIYTEQNEQVLVKPESKRIEVTQAETEWVDEQKLVREASTRIEAVPAQYKTITEQVLVKPETIKLVSVPAQFEEVTEQVIDKPAHTEWKQGSRFITDAIETRTNSGTGEVMCLVEVPATYKTVTRTVQTAPASVKEVVVPAEYKTVTKTVVDVPATTREVEIPAQYTSVRKLKVIKPASSYEVVVPAEYKTVSRRVKTSDEKLEWREVLCDINMTRELVTELQQKLHQAGYFDSPVDGIYQQLTQNGVNRFARNNGLPFGSNYIALEVANALGLSY